MIDPTMLPKEAMATFIMASMMSGYRPKKEPSLTLTKLENEEAEREIERELERLADIAGMAAQKLAIALAME